MSHSKRPSDNHTALSGGNGGAPRGGGPSAPIDPARARSIRREVLLMRALQSRVVGPALRYFADPQQILEMGMAFWSSRVILTAVEFGVFTELALGPRSAQGLQDRFGWHPRAAGPFLDALVGM